MNFLSSCITYVRRIVKTPSNADITDALIIDYINRFWTQDVDARMQLFDLKTKYQFQTTPVVDKYNMPLYGIQTEPLGEISFYPVYQGFLGPAYINGVEVAFQTQKSPFFNMFPNVPQQLNQVVEGDGGSSYSFTLPILPGINQNFTSNSFQGILRGHVDMAGIIATEQNQDPPLSNNLNVSFDPPYNGNSVIPNTSLDSAFFITCVDEFGNNVVVQDSGQFLPNNVNCGLLTTLGPAPYGIQLLSAPNPSDPPYTVTTNVVNYLTGEVHVNFPTNIPVGNAINVQCYFFNTGLPRSILSYNNVLTLRSPPDTQYNVELQAYLSPCAFFNSSQSMPFAYMTEYIARGAARKILSDTGDVEQFQFYEPLFKEQELLVWKRSQRQFTATRTNTIYSTGTGYGNIGNFGGGYL